MFAQYLLADASPARIQATTISSVASADLAAAGRGQVSIPSSVEDASMYLIDTSSTPKIVAYASSGDSFYICSVSTFIVVGAAVILGILTLDGVMSVI